MTTATKIPDETPIQEIVTAQRPCKHLVAAGFVTLGDVRKKGLEAAFSTKYVGDASLAELRAAIGPQGPVAVSAPLEEEPEYEENGLPIRIEQVPGGPSHISWIPAKKVDDGLQQPIFIEFEGKRNIATISARMYFMRKYRRDERKVDDAIDSGAPWRTECAEMLRGFNSHGTGFILLTD